MPVTLENLHDVITYHQPTEQEIEMIGKIRNASENLCDTILRCTPTCGDQTAAIRKVREAMMTANAAVVLRDTV
jgi:hypothetical protein